jgi:hypothetical protein
MHPQMQELDQGMAFGIEMLGPTKKFLLITPRIILNQAVSIMLM